jgi:hypothetical protein
LLLCISGRTISKCSLNVSQCSPVFSKCFPVFSKCPPNVLQSSPNVCQMFPTVRYMLSLCKDYVAFHCWCACGPENIAVGERSQAFIQLKPCQHPHYLLDSVSGMPLPIACNCSIALRSGTCLAAHSGMQFIRCLLGCSNS